MAERTPQRPYTHQRAPDEEDNGASVETWASEQDYSLESNLLELAPADCISSDSVVHELLRYLNANEYQVPSVLGSNPWEYDFSSEPLIDAGPASMGTGFVPIARPDQPTVNPAAVDIRNCDNSDVLVNSEAYVQAENYLNENLNSQCADVSGFNALRCLLDEAAKVCPSIASREYDGTLRLVPDIDHSTMLDHIARGFFWEERTEDGVQCTICRAPLTRRGNLKVHVSTKKCKKRWESLDKAKKWQIMCRDLKSCNSS